MYLYYLLLSLHQVTNEHPTPSLSLGSSKNSNIVVAVVVGWTVRLVIPFIGR